MLGEYLLSINNNMDFKTTLEWGKKIERAFVCKMLSKYPEIEKVEFAPDIQFKDWDIKLTVWGKEGLQEPRYLKYCLRD